jgi:predicted ATP-binding protein involved in virulence
MTESNDLTAQLSDALGSGDGYDDLSNVLSSVEEVPDFEMNEDVGLIQLKRIRLENFRAYEDFELDFAKEDEIEKFACYIGPNGCGKTTILEAIQMAFSSYDGYDLRRLVALLGKNIRHVDGSANTIYSSYLAASNDDVSLDEDFKITADIAYSGGDYQVVLTKRGFGKNDHPEEVKEILGRLCFFARFDQELHQFQLNRGKWEEFKDLFESVTGFTVEEDVSLFNSSSDPRIARSAEEYVLAFNVQKPNEMISHKECSAGERKIIKTFSTLLNKDYAPAILLVDNVAMHVESGRHLGLIEAMKRCFPDTQIFTTTHSYHISKNFGARHQIYDIRFMNESEKVNNEKWRLYFADEIKDAMSKVESMTNISDEQRSDLINRSTTLLANYVSEEDLKDQTSSLLKEITELYLEDLKEYYT